MYTNTIITFFSIILFEFRYKFWFIHNYRFLHKTLPRPWWGYRPDFGNYFKHNLRSCDRESWHVTVHRDMWPCIVTNFFVIKPTRCTTFPNLLRHETLHFRAVPLPIIRSLFTVHLALVYVIQVWRQLPRRAGMALLESCLQTCMAYTSAKCTVIELLMMGRGTARNM